MQRILIIGNSGAGKSTFAIALAEKLGLPLVHLDKLFWNGNWEHVSRDEFDTLLQQALEQPQWIIDGNFDRTMPRRLEYCDAVFFFDIPTAMCLWGITKRVFTNYGKTRRDMGGNCPEYFDMEKLKLCRHVLGFNRQYRKNYYALLEKATHAKVTVFRNRKQARQFLEQIDKRVD